MGGRLNMTVEEIKVIAKQVVATTITIIYITIGIGVAIWFD